MSAYGIVKDTYGFLRGAHNYIKDAYGLVWAHTGA
jgi:hypothetical protein